MGWLSASVLDPCSCLSLTSSAPPAIYSFFCSVSSKLRCASSVITLIYVFGEQSICSWTIMADSVSVWRYLVEFLTGPVELNTSALSVARFLCFLAPPSSFCLRGACYGLWAACKFVAAPSGSDYFSTKAVRAKWARLSKSSAACGELQLVSFPFLLVRLRMLSLGLTFRYRSYVFK